MSYERGTPVGLGFQGRPLSSKEGTNKTVKSCFGNFQDRVILSCFLFARKRTGGCVSEAEAGDEEEELFGGWPAAASEPRGNHFPLSGGRRPWARPRGARFRAKMEPIKTLLESQGHNLALTALHVPSSLDSGARI